MGGVRDKFYLETSCGYSYFKCHDLDEVDEAHTRHVDLKTGSNRGWAGDGAREGLDQQR